MSLDEERWRRWRLALGDPEASEGSGLGDRDQRLDRALSALYEQGDDKGGGRRGGLGSSSPRVARWLGDIREFFPTPVVQVIQKDAFERLGLKRLLLEPEFLSVVEADIHLIADIVSLRSAMPEKSKASARNVVEKVVRQLMERLEQKTVQAVRGALDRSRRTRRPRFADIDWHRTIRANLHNYQPEFGTIAPDRLIGFGRAGRRSNLEEIILCVDQSGSMASSVVYSSVFGAALASVAALSVKFVAFDTAVLDLSDELADPVDVLFGVQLGGGTDINQALAYCEGLVREPSRCHLVLISDLFEGGNAEAMLTRAQSLVTNGVNVIVLLALSDDGRTAYDDRHAQAFAAMGCPVFACTPDQFPDLMATALKRGDIGTWAASNDVKTV
jgi:Mg-chelatase subunit ChlD